MLYLTCTTISSVDLAHYGVSRAKDWVSMDCGTNRSTVNANNQGKERKLISFTVNYLFRFASAFLGLHTERNN